MTAIAILALAAPAVADEGTEPDPDPQKPAEVQERDAGNVGETGRVPYVEKALEDLGKPIPSL